MVFKIFNKINKRLLTRESIYIIIQVLKQKKVTNFNIYLNTKVRNKVQIKTPCLIIGSNQ